MIRFWRLGRQCGLKTKFVAPMPSERIELPTSGFLNNTYETDALPLSYKGCFTKLKDAVLLPALIFTYESSVMMLKFSETQ